MQGVGVGLATGAIGASLLELEPAGSRLAGLLTSGSQMLGLAIGALGSAALVQYGPYPTGLVWWLLLAALVAGILAVAVMPEPGGRRPAGSARCGRRYAFPVPSGPRSSQHCRP